MNRHFIIAVMIALSGACTSNELPLRTDCIVKVMLHWPDTLQGAAKVRTISNLLRAIALSPTNGGPEIYPNIAIQGEDRELLYLQLKTNCSNRVELITNLMDHVNPRVVDMPGYSVLADRIAPSPTTIDTWGRWWSDQPN